MKLRNKLAGAFFLLTTTIIIAQQDMPIIPASSTQVDVREGNDFWKNAWTLAPEVKPDIYTSGKTGEFVTFYTDLDSISYKIHPDSVYNFIILLNGKDSAYTQIKYEYIPSYLDILKGAEKYNLNNKNTIPKFTYQDASNPNLQALRRGFNLDSIAGEGNEVSKILNLLHWIHDVIPHDGNHENPTIKNALSLINECKRDDRGLNCRGLATVLNECYLSMGIKSRFVTCMPKDSVFNDCHVINMVYASELRKWIWIDSTHDAYVMDGEGMLLGLDEVRENLISDKNLILNPDANWNKKHSTLKEYYLYQYMAKNLYRFSCPLQSEYNYETAEKGKIISYVELIPQDGYNKEPKYAERTFNKSGVIHRTYKTGSPEVFWAKPK